ncbi:hypothetical protein BC829DRAFT_297577 [Chytridium lagenaria]|nr:hypothetical protein BC829DRAFT_297577 [Chytridium lagenaria]
MLAIKVVGPDRVTRRFSVDTAVVHTWEDIERQIKTLHALSEPFYVTYLDEDNEEIRIDSDGELADLIAGAKRQGLSSLRFTVTLKDGSGNVMRPILVNQITPSQHTGRRHHRTCHQLYPHHHHQSHSTEKGGRFLTMGPHLVRPLLIPLPPRNPSDVHISCIRIPAMSVHHHSHLRSSEIAMPLSHQPPLPPKHHMLHPSIPLTTSTPSPRFSLP